MILDLLACRDLAHSHTYVLDSQLSERCGQLGSMASPGLAHAAPGVGILADARKEAVRSAHCEWGGLEGAPLAAMAPPGRQVDPPNGWLSDALHARYSSQGSKWNSKN